MNKFLPLVVEDRIKYFLNKINASDDHDLTFFNRKYVVARRRLQNAQRLFNKRKISSRKLAYTKAAFKHARLEYEKVLEFKSKNDVVLALLDEQLCELKQRLEGVEQTKIADIKRILRLKNDRKNNDQVEYLTRFIEETLNKQIEMYENKINRVEKLINQRIFGQELWSKQVDKNLP